MNAQTNAPPDEIAAFCQRWRVAELALFGSVLRDAKLQDAVIRLIEPLPSPEAE